MAEGPTYPEALEIVTRILTAILAERGVEPASLTPDRPLHAFDVTTTDSLDLDSLDALDLMEAIEAELGVDISEDVDVDGMRTIGDVAAMVHRRAGSVAPPPDA